MLEFTDWAIQIIERANSGARRLNPDARIRLMRTRTGMEAVLTDEAEATDEEVTVGTSTVFVEAGLEGLVDIEEPHDRIVLRPRGSTPNVREDH
jgi:hypothetical protein